MKKYSVAVYDIHGGASLLTHKDKTEFTLATAKKYAAEFGYKFYGSVKVFDAAESIPPAPVKKNPAPSLGRYQGRHTVSSDGSVYALIVRVDRDGQENVIHGYKGRHFATLKAAEKSTRAYIDKIDIVKNPLPRSRAARPAYIGKRSQITGRAPSARLKKRRAKNTDVGYFPNPTDSAVIAAQRGLNMVAMTATELRALISDFKGVDTVAARDIVAGAKQMLAAKKQVYPDYNKNPVAENFDGFIATYTVSAELNRDYWVVLGKFADKKIAVDFAKMCAKQYPECAVEVTDNK